MGFVFIIQGFIPLEKTDCCSFVYCIVDPVSFFVVFDLPSIAYVDIVKKSIIRLLSSSKLHCPFLIHFRFVLIFSLGIKK